MKMPEKVRLAVDVIRHVRDQTDGQPRRVEDLAVLFGTTKNFLHQIVAALRKAGMINVIKGPKGGVGAAIKDHTLLEIYQLFGYMNEPVTSTLPSADIEKRLRLALAEIVV